jgi:hypothetical protein
MLFLSGSQIAVFIYRFPDKFELNKLPTIEKTQAEPEG